MQLCILLLVIYLGLLFSFNRTCRCCTLLVIKILRTISAGQCHALHNRNDVYSTNAPRDNSLLFCDQFTAPQFEPTCRNYLSTMLQPPSQIYFSMVRIQSRIYRASLTVPPIDNHNNYLLCNGLRASISQNQGINPDPFPEGLPTYQQQPLRSLQHTINQ